MSTGAVIARQSGDGWKGVHNHCDGYPTGLGRALWRSLRDEYRGEVPAFLAGVIDSHPGGWSHFTRALNPELWDAYERSGYSEEFFAAHATRECYCHSPRFAEGRCASASAHRCEAAGGRVAYDPGADGAGDLAWAYCFNQRSLTVFQALPADVRRIDDAFQVASGDVYQSRPHAWQVVGIYSLRGDEPEWSVVECGRGFERCAHHAWVHLEGQERLLVRLDPALSKLSMRAYLHRQRTSE